MSGWPNRIFVVFSILWGVVLLALLALIWLSGHFMLNETAGSADVLAYFVVTIGGGAIWFGIFRLTRWFDQRS
jgi:hypothetical protein